MATAITNWSSTIILCMMIAIASSASILQTTDIEEELKNMPFGTEDLKSLDTNGVAQLMMNQKIDSMEKIEEFKPISLPQDFESYDIINQDGIIDLKELIKATGAFLNAEQAFNDTDLDYDGKISRVEFESAPWLMTDGHTVNSGEEDNGSKENEEESKESEEESVESEESEEESEESEEESVESEESEEESEESSEESESEESEESSEETSEESEESSEESEESREEIESEESREESKESKEKSESEESREESKESKEECEESKESKESKEESSSNEKIRCFIVKN